MPEAGISPDRPLPPFLLLFLLQLFYFSLRDSPTCFGCLLSINWSAITFNLNYYKLISQIGFKIEEETELVVS